MWAIAVRSATSMTVIPPIFHRGEDFLHHIVIGGTDDEITMMQLP